jgi:hypothetical protein
VGADQAGTPPGVEGFGVDTQLCGKFVARQHPGSAQAGEAVAQVVLPAQPTHQLGMERRAD